MNYIQNNSIFWIEVDKVKPNPYQPRREFNEGKLNDLAESIKMYGLLAPLVVTRQEVEKEDGGLNTVYELISGERRLRASKIAGLVQVPVIIRTGEDDDRVKLELAIIENLQREDLNPVERARAFHQLAGEFGFKHFEIAKKVGRSREFVSNTIRILALPEEILNALAVGKISEGHARPILMLKDKPEEQITLYKEVMFKKLTVRESEAIARRIAYDKIRKQSRVFDPELVEMEDKLAESLGTRVLIEKKNVGGKIMIDFFSNDDLQKIIDLLNSQKISLTSVHDLNENTLKSDQTLPNPESNEDTEFLKNIADIKDDEDKSIESDDWSKDLTENKDEVKDEMKESPEENSNEGKVSAPSYSNDESDDSKEEAKDSPVNDFTI